MDSNFSKQELDFHFKFCKIFFGDLSAQDYLKYLLDFSFPVSVSFPFFAMLACVADRRKGGKGSKRPRENLEERRREPLTPTRFICAPMRCAGDEVEVLFQLHKVLIDRSELTF